MVNFHDSEWELSITTNTETLLLPEQSMSMSSVIGKFVRVGTHGRLLQCVCTAPDSPVQTVPFFQLGSFITGILHYLVTYLTNSQKFNVWFRIAQHFIPKCSDAESKFMVPKSLVIEFDLGSWVSVKRYVRTNDLDLVIS